MVAGKFLVYTQARTEIGHHYNVVWATKLENATVFSGRLPKEVKKLLPNVEPYAQRVKIIKTIHMVGEENGLRTHIKNPKR